jgi:hypothetical protein
MLETTVGSLAAVAAGHGDPSRGAMLPLELAYASDGVLKVWWLKRTETKRHASGKVLQVLDVDAAIDAGASSKNMLGGSTAEGGDEPYRGVQVEREKELLPESEHGVLTDHDAYIVCFSCKANSKHVIYVWQGCRCPVDVRAAAALKSMGLKDGLHLEGGVDLLTVEQHAEPPLFCALFTARSVRAKMRAYSTKYKELMAAKQAKENHDLGPATVVVGGADGGLATNKELEQLHELLKETPPDPLVVLHGSRLQSAREAMHSTPSPDAASSSSSNANALSRSGRQSLLELLDGDNVDVTGGEDNAARESMVREERLKRGCRLVQVHAGPGMAWSEGPSHKYIPSLRVVELGSSWLRDHEHAEIMRKKSGRSLTVVGEDDEEDDDEEDDDDDDDDDDDEGVEGGEKKVARAKAMFRKAGTKLPPQDSYMLLVKMDPGGDDGTAFSPPAEAMHEVKEVQGTLLKRGNRRNKAWKERYCVLVPSTQELYYYTKKKGVEGAKAKGQLQDSIKLSAVTRATLVDSKNKWHPEAGGRNVKLPDGAFGMVLEEPDRDWYVAHCTVYIVHTIHTIHTIHNIHTSAAHFHLVLYSYCTRTVLILYSYCTLYCTHTALYTALYTAGSLQCRRTVARPCESVGSTPWKRSYTTIKSKRGPGRERRRQWLRLQRRVQVDDGGASSGMVLTRVRHSVLPA